MRGPGGVDAGAGTVQSFGVQVQARNKKCKRFCSPVSFVFSMSRFFFCDPSFNSSWNNSLFIFHLRYYHVWASASLGPSSRASCFSFGGSSEAKPQQLTSFGSKATWLSTFMHLHHPPSAPVPLRL